MGGPLSHARRELEEVLACTTDADARLSALIQRRGLSPDAVIILAAHPLVDMLASHHIDPDVAAGLANGLIDPVDILFAPRRLLSPPRSQAPPSPAIPAAYHPSSQQPGDANRRGQSQPAAPASPQTPPPEPAAASADTLLAHLWWGAGQAQLNAVRSWFASQASPAATDADGRAASPAAAPPAGLPAEAALSYAAAILARCQPAPAPARVQPQGPRMPPALAPAPAGRPAPRRPPQPPPQPAGLQLMAADLLVRLLAAHPAALVADAELCGDLLPALLRAAELLLEHAAPAAPARARERAAAAAARSPSPRSRPPSPPPPPEALPSKAAARERLGALCAALEARRTLHQLLALALEPLRPSAPAAAAALKLLALLYRAQLLRDPLAPALALQHSARLWHATAGFARPPAFEAAAAEMQADLAGALAAFRPQVRGSGPPGRGAGAAVRQAADR
jgi:hypothetical protein